MKYLLLTIALITLTFTGCAKQQPSDRCLVKGVVRYKGKPVPFGFIAFISTADPMNQITGQIFPDGHFELDPAPVGECAVKIQVNNAYDAQAYQQQGKAAPPEVIPRELGLKYADEKTTPVKKTLQPGENDLGFIDIE